VQPISGDTMMLCTFEQNQTLSTQKQFIFYWQIHKIQSMIFIFIR